MDPGTRATGTASRIALRWIGRALAVGILVLLVIRLGDGWSELRERGVRVRFGWLMAAVATYVLVQLGYVRIWSWMLSRFGPRPPYRDALEVCGKAWLGRYLPGKLWVVGAKVMLGTRLGFGRRTLAVVSLVELCLMILVAGTFGSACLLVAAALGLPSLPGWPVAVALVAGFVALSPPVFRRILSLAARATGREALRPEEMLPVSALLGTAVRMIGITLLGSLSWVFLLLALFAPDRISIELVLLAVGSGPFGAIAGMLAVFAPAGIGVREGTVAGLLTAALPLEEAIAIAMLARVNTLVGDALYFAISRAFAPRAKPEADSDG